MHFAFPSNVKTAPTSRLMIAGLAVVGAGLCAMNAPTATGPLLQHRDVVLTAGEVDWATVISTAQDNLIGLQADAAKGGTDLSTALNTVSDHFNTQISTGLAGFETGINNALFGGWYGGDDGYVFGLFGGEPVTGPQGPMTGSLLATLSADFSAGKAEQAYSDFNAYTLEVTDHTLKPLLSPLVDESTHGVITHGIPFQLSEIQTKLLDTFADYNELKDGLKALVSPDITAQLILTKDLDGIAADFSAGNTTQGMSDLNNLSSDVFGAFINGADVGTNPVDGSLQFFPGLLSDGGLLQHLVLTWPEQIVTALGQSTTTLAADSVSGGLPDLFTGLTADAVGSSAPDFLTGLLSF